MKIFLKISVLVVLVVLLFVVALTGFFTQGIISNHIYFPQNVFEEIWNMLAVEKRGGETLLTTGSEDAYVDWDFGIDFVGVYIPSCNASLHFRWYNHEIEHMTIYFWLDDAHYQFRYVYETKVLYGDVEHAYLVENLLVDYFQWFEATSHLSSKFSLDDLGDYTYQFADPIYSYELTK